MTPLLLPLAVLSLARAVRALTAELAAGRWRQGRGRATAEPKVTLTTTTGNSTLDRTLWPGWTTR